MIKNSVNKPDSFTLLRLFVISTASFILFFTCTDYYNPFTDTSNAGTRLEPSFTWGDTLEIFSTESINVKLLVRDLIDSVKLYASGNRLWQDTLIFPVNDNIEFSIPVSFNDTGTQKISAETYIRGGGTVREDGSVYVLSPLRMDSLSASSGYPVSLSSPVLSDDDVLYHWSLGNIAEIEWWNPETTVTFFKTGHSDSGVLWVSDKNGISRSPEYYFSYSIGDTSGPLIFCINKGFINKDTVFTGDSLFYFRVHISDQANSSIYRTEINGIDFPFSNPPEYLYPVINTDTISDFIALSVKAADNIRTMNISEKTFYLGYNPELGKSGGEAVILNISYPSESSIFNSGHVQDFYGAVDNYTGSVLSMRIGVNGSTRQTLEFFSDSTGQSWYTSAPLSEGENIIDFEVFDSSGIIHVSRSYYVLHDPLAEDTIPPYIVSVFVNNIDITSSTQKTFDVKELPVKAVVFDRGSGLSIVTCQEKPMSPDKNSGPFVWRDTVSISRSLNGNLLNITAKDSAGLCDTFSTVIYYNRPPVITHTPDSFQIIKAGGIYRDTISFADLDGDSVSVFSGNKNPDVISLNTDPSNVFIEWNTLLQDTGLYTLSYTLFDTYNDTVSFQWNLELSSLDTVVGPVFSSETGNIPQWIDAGDTLMIPLSVHEGTGTPPFIFKALVENGDPLIINDTAFWYTSSEDSGYHMVTVSVTDFHKRSASLTQEIYVALNLYSPSVECDFTTLDTLGNGALDMHMSPAPDTIRFSVFDMDNPIAENLSVTVSSSRSSIAGDIDSTGSFYVIIEPSGNNPPWDTLTVTVTDRAGNTGVFKRPLYYGYKPDTPVLLHPAENGELISMDSSISWSGSDPDGDTLTYSLFIDTTTVFTTPQYTGTDSSFSLSGKELYAEKTYYCAVTASDGRYQIESAVRSFRIIFPHTVKVTVNTALPNTAISSELYGFPLLLRLNENNFPFSLSSDNGSDIRIRKPDSSLMSFEIEMWNKEGTEAAVWVKTDTIFPNNDSQSIFIHTGQTGSPGGSDGASVFNELNGFTGVWHLSDSGNDTVVSEAGGRHEGSVNESVSQYSTAACIGKGFEFDHTLSEAVTVQDHSVLDFTGEMTLEGWVYIDTLIQYYEYGIISKMAVPDYSGYNLIYDNNESSSPTPLTGFRFELPQLENTSGRVYAESHGEIKTWYYVAGVYDNSRMSIFLNGILMNEISYSDSITTNDTTLLIGSHYGMYHDGKLDEIRVSGQARSQDWIRMSYENQKPESDVLEYE